MALNLLAKIADQPQLPSSMSRACELVYSYRIVSNDPYLLPTVMPTRLQARLGVPDDTVITRVQPAAVILGQPFARIYVLFTLMAA